MRLPLEWLAEWIDLPPIPELVERLDMGGFEDTLIEETGPDLSAVVVGAVLEAGRHPNADRLSLCRVDVGGAEPVEIVCGAPNVAAGQKVAVARPGGRLPDGTKLKKAKIRGVTSHGMICSTRELGLGDEHEGILVLDGGARVGEPLAEWIELGAGVLELGITPNRGDLASLMGVAREVRAFFGGEIRSPETQAEEVGEPAAGEVSVTIEAPEQCHHYVARVVRGVCVGPSPDWLVRRLEAAGLRSVNNVVDVTNAVLLEFGQPLHAFDLATLRGSEIRVRPARPGEKLTTLDGEDRELRPEDLVIADAERAIALAGVMGGRDTEVGEATTDVLIESAHFHPTSVRLSARRHGLRSEASYRFERGVDRDGVARAADRCARLLAELAGGRVAPGRVEARGATPPITREIRLEVARANRLLGTDLEAREMADLLERVAIGCSEPEAGTLVGRVPSHRNDLHLHQDLTEEVARIYGYDRIPITEPEGVLRPVQLPAWLVASEQARDALVAAGLTEVVSYPFLGDAALAALGLGADDPARRSPRLVNPFREEEPRLRPSLLPSLLQLARQNLDRQVEALRIFEVARVFQPAAEAGEAPREPLQAAGLLALGGPGGLWQRGGAPLFFEVKGIAETLLNQLGYVPTLQREGCPPYLHPGAGGAILVGGRMIGAVGELHPDVAARFEITVPCAAFEVDLSDLASLSRHAPRYRGVSRFPQIRRDLAVVVDRTLAAGELREAIRKAAGRDCIAVELFDRYEGGSVATDRVSLAFRLVFQRTDRTLVESEIQPSLDRVVRMLSERFGGELRD